MLRFLVIALLPIALAGCGSRATYSTEEVVDAFQRRGYTLVIREFPKDTVAARGGDLLIPRGGQPFLVVVGLPAGGDGAWADYKSSQTGDSFDVRRGNVLVISDGGLSTFDRERVLGAMSSLPNRGAEVEIAGHV